MIIIDPNASVIANAGVTANPAMYLRRHAQVVRDDDHRQCELLADAREQLQHLRLHGASSVDTGSSGTRISGPGANARASWMR